MKVLTLIVLVIVFMISCVTVPTSNESHNKFDDPNKPWSKVEK